MMRTLALALSMCGLAVGAANGQVAVRAGVLHTMAGEPITNGVVVVTDGKIAAVGPAEDITIPPGHHVLEAAVAVPGLVDARATVGLAGWLNQPQDRDELDRSTAIQPELRAIDAFDSRDALVAWIRGLGVTTVHTGHAPGMLVSGQTMIVKTGPDGEVDANVLVPFAMVACSLGASAKAPRDQAPGNRAKAVAMLRQRLIEARAYAARRRAEDEAKRPERDLGLDALVEVLEGRAAMLIHAHREQDLLAALRLREEFGVRIVLDGAAEAYRLTDRIREAAVPVIAHPPMMRTSGERENATFRLGGILREAGIPFAYGSGYEDYVPRSRVVLWEAAIGGAHGLGFDGALRAITIDAARILGVADRVGSLEQGKDGDLALFDGDPFEYTTHCIGVVIDGIVVSTEPR